MTIRGGMIDLVTQFRLLVNDSAATSFTDDRVQQILDRHRSGFYREPLVVTAQQIGAGTVAYYVYQSSRRYLEGTASGTVYFRLYDSLGSVIASGYALDADAGMVTFTADQAGSARYLDGRAFDLYAAAADGWREKAAAQASGYDFRVEGRQYSRSQWFKHCMEMAAHFDSMGGFAQATIERGDMC